MAPWTRSAGAKESCLKQAFKVCKAGLELNRLAHIIECAIDAAVRISFRSFLGALTAGGYQICSLIPRRSVSNR